MTAVVFADAQRAVRDALRAALAARSEPSAQGVTVGVRVPSWHSDDAPAIPYVVVRVDGNVRDARLNGRATVRVTVWHRDEGLALDLAALCEALLLGGLATDAGIRSVGPVSSPIPSEDPDNGTPLAFFRVTARMRPTNLS